MIAIINIPSKSIETAATKAWTVIDKVKSRPLPADLSDVGPCNRPIGASIAR
jgi:hypothetical protein